MTYTNSSKLNIYSKDKLLKHIDKLYMWETKGYTYPIIVDFDLTNVCNNKCPLCNGSKGLDKTTVHFDKVKDILSQLQELNVRSVGIGGGGEPTCHPHFPEILRLIREKNIEVGLYTNGYQLSDEIIDSMIKHCTFIRVSLDADGPDIYKKAHGMDIKAFEDVINNIERLVALKNKLKTKVLIGTNYLVGPHTISGVYNATRLSKNLGVNSMRLRPYFNYFGNKAYTKNQAIDMLNELRRCLEFNGNNFVASFPQKRCEWMVDGHMDRDYNVCYSTHFLTSITAELNMYPCCQLKTNNKYVFGNLHESSFKNIWHSDRKKAVCENIDMRDCPNPCMYDHHNMLLFNMKKPILHSNFL